MQPTVKLVTGGSGLGNLGASLASIARAQVYVGIPEASSGRPQKGITNAQLAFLHTYGVRRSEMRRQVMARMVRTGMSFEASTAMYLFTHGSPLMQIPARPIIEPAIEAKGNKEDIEKELELALKSFLDGDRPEALRHLNMAGLTGQNAARGWFTDPRNNWAPNAPSTIKRKGSSQPLIDTGELRKSITYVVAGGQP